MEILYLEYPMKSISAKCGHVKRRLNQNDPLTGKVLEFALSVIDDALDKKGSGSDDNILNGMAKKLIDGEPLSGYEHHIMVDVLLVHKKCED